MNINAETKRKLRDMGASALLSSLENQDESLCMGLTFEERIQMVVDEAHSSYITDRIGRLTKRACLRYPEADIRQLDFDEERKLNRVLIAELATCGYIERTDNLILQGYSGTGKTYMSCAFAKESCRHQMRTYYVRIPDLEEQRKSALTKTGTDKKLITKLSNYELLVLDEWLLDEPDEGFRAFLLEIMERRFKEGSTIFCTQFQQKDWHARLGGGVTAEAIMDRIVHNANWIEMGDVNMRAKYSKVR